MNMNHLDDVFAMLSLKNPELTFPTLSTHPEVARKLLSKQKDCGPTKIDINISLSNNSNQNSISVSFSKELATESVRDLKSLIETFVRDVEEVYGLE